MNAAFLPSPAFFALQKQDESFTKKSILKLREGYIVTAITQRGCKATGLLFRHV